MSDTLPEGVVRAMDGYQGVVIDYAHDACHLSQMRSARARAEDAIAAHVAAEVAAERARCVAVAEDAAMQAHGVLHRRDMDLAPESVVSYWSGTHHSALSIRKKLDAALPPATPEGT